MYLLMMRAGKFLERHMWLYYLLNYTWGMITTLTGWLTIFFCWLVLAKDIHRHGPAHYIAIGDNWGGLEFGVCFLVANNMGEAWTLHTKQHETGHSFQNAVLGPFMIFLVAIPSACRYWYQVIAGKHGKTFSADWYDNAWFEGSATRIGEEYDALKSE